MTDHSRSLTAVTATWARLPGEAMEAAVAANSAALDAFVSAAGGGQDDTAPDATREDGRRPGSVPSVLFEDEDWVVERSVSGETPAVGNSVRFEKTISESDVERFAAVGGDTNRLHLDDAYAEQTRFRGRIVHGTLVSALVSAALARLPGVTIYLSQDLTFLGPVHIGARVSARVEVVEDVGEGRYRLETVVETDDEVVVDGEAVVLVEDAPDVEAPTRSSSRPRP